MIDHIGKYKIVEIIGEGGMGTVYKAIDTVIQRNVAIKIMAPDQMHDATVKERFMREARVIGQLQHPNIITIHDIGEYNKKPFLVVEFLQGKDFESLLEIGPMPPTETLLSLLIDVCDALHCAHQKGIVHRDVKPANIFLLDSGKVILMDFGLALMGDARLTKTGIIVGTVHYMSPEHIEGLKTDHLTDIYSLGIVMFELFTRKLPFDGDSISEIMKKILHGDAIPFEPVDTSMPKEMMKIVKKATRKEKDKRFQSTLLLADELKKIQKNYTDKPLPEKLTELKKPEPNIQSDVIRIPREIDDVFHKHVDFNFYTNKADTQVKKISFFAAIIFLVAVCAVFGLWFGLTGSDEQKKDNVLQNEALLTDKEALKHSPRPRKLSETSGNSDKAEPNPKLSAETENTLKSDFGEVLINAYVAGESITGKADIIIDGRIFSTNIPLNISLKSGDHNIEIDYRNYSGRTKFKVKSGVFLTVHINLKEFYHNLNTDTRSR
ncbi:serine/threonine protein kinase [candidate division CSSED10-310 bacterium]|uniref:Serine/threonine protein kinase n=1 Tax=candidate division CSSED10-310 bacterium TaxID=2855610 RepID=A0ABV6YSY0_UNCC1